MYKKVFVENFAKVSTDMSFDFKTWYSEAKEGTLLVKYKGAISGDLIMDILNIIEKKLNSMNEKARTKKKIYNVLVETLQNLYHHIDKLPEQKEEANTGIAAFTLCKTDENYKIYTGNFVHNSKIQLLKDRIDQINYLTKDELKSLYKLILSNQEFSEKGGGGLGMIDIARKTGNKLEYHFYSYDKEYNFFSLVVKI